MASILFDPPVSIRETLTLSTDADRSTEQRIQTGSVLLLLSFLTVLSFTLYKDTGHGSADTHQIYRIFAFSDNLLVKKIKCGQGQLTFWIYRRKTNLPDWIAQNKSVNLYFTYNFKTSSAFEKNSIMGSSEKP